MTWRFGVGPDKTGLSPIGFAQGIALGEKWSCGEIRPAASGKTLTRRPLGLCSTLKSLGEHNDEHLAA